MIKFSSNELEISDGNYSLAQIYSDEGNNGNLKKIGNNSYFLEGDLIIGNGTLATHLTLKNETLEISGSRLQVLKNAVLQLGVLNSDGGTEQGACLTAENIKLAYGFGSDTIIDGESQSGDILFYASKINIFGFWAFFGGANQLVDIRDCLINGFGRIEGKNSILSQVIFEKANGRYGILSPKGSIKTLKNIKVTKTLESYGQRSEVYLNPSFVDSLVISDGNFANYDKLVYVEKNNTVNTVFAEFIDCFFENGLSGYFLDERTKLYETYSIKGILRDVAGNVVSGATVKLKNALGNEVFNGLTDDNGRFSSFVRVKEINKLSEVSNNPFTIEFEKDTVFSSWTFEIKDKLVSAPFYLLKVSDCDAPNGIASCNISQEDFDKIKAILTGRRKLNEKENTLTYYFPDGSPAAIFKTYGADGSPTVKSVYDAVPIL